MTAQAKLAVYVLVPRKNVFTKNFPVFQSGKDHYLVLYRNNDVEYRPNCWSLPAGRIEVGETPTQAAVRELKEETGLYAHENSLFLLGTMYRKPDVNFPDVWIDFLFVAMLTKGEPCNAEPHLHSQIEFKSIDDLTHHGCNFMPHQRSFLTLAGVYNRDHREWQESVYVEYDPKTGESNGYFQ